MSLHIPFLWLDQTQLVLLIDAAVILVHRAFYSPTMPGNLFAASIRLNMCARGLCVSHNCAVKLACA